jgi:hypothetical protein
VFESKFIVSLFKRRSWGTHNKHFFSIFAHL